MPSLGMYTAESAIGVEVRSSASGAAVWRLASAPLAPFSGMRPARAEMLAVSGRGWRNSFAFAQPYESGLVHSKILIPRLHMASVPAPRDLGVERLSPSPWVKHFGAKETAWTEGSTPASRPTHRGLDTPPYLAETISGD